MALRVIVPRVWALGLPIRAPRACPGPHTPANDEVGPPAGPQGSSDGCAGGYSCSPCAGGELQEILVRFLPKGIGEGGKCLPNDIPYANARRGWNQGTHPGAAPAGGGNLTDGPPSPNLQL